MMQPRTPCSLDKTHRVRRPHRRARLGVAILCTACVPKGDAPTDQPATVADGPPTITAVALDCDVDAAVWTFSVDTDAWSGGAYLWLATGGDTTGGDTTGGETVERHTIYSQAAASDGSTDQLGAELDIVADWRDAVPGSSTQFRCQDEKVMAAQVTIYDRYGSEATDCQRWGVPGVLDNIVDVPACE